MDFNAAKSYITEKLGVEFVTDKSVLLNSIIRSFQEKVPFQNISVSILPPKDRFPSEKSVLDSGSSLEGGLCIHNNWFFKILLEALGYDVDFIAGKTLQPPVNPERPAGGHIAIVVKDLTKRGDLHLVDVGSGYPLFKAVSLRSLPYTATDVKLTYRIVEERGQWHKEHKDDSSDSYTRFLSYDMTPCRFIEFFHQPMLKMLNEEWLIGGITAVRYLQPESADIPDVPDFKKDYDYALIFKDETLTFKNSSGYEYNERLQANHYMSTLRTYFPNIPQEKILEKLANLSEQASQLRY